MNYMMNFIVTYFSVSVKGKEGIISKPPTHSRRCIKHTIHADRPKILPDSIDIAALRQAGILEYDEALGTGREKAFVLTDKGRAYAAPFLRPLDTVEARALELLGEDKLLTLTGLLLDYDRALNQALEEER